MNCKAEEVVVEHQFGFKKNKETKKAMKRKNNT